MSGAGAVRGWRRCRTKATAARAALGGPPHVAVERALRGPS